MNPFDQPSIASRYARGRPDFHAVVIEQIKDLLSLDEPIQAGLDVGCGTGLSTKALLAIADHAIGVDPSLAMLSEVEQQNRLYYFAASAEELPFAEKQFDLITVSCALHWFDRHRFLAEAARVLKDRASLVSYENGFPGRMLENPQYHDWQLSFYQRFPQTPRDNSPPTEDELAASGFRMAKLHRYSNTVRFTSQQLSLYFSTQSNAVEAIERGQETVDSFRAIVEEETAAYFDGQQSAAFEFLGSIRVFEKCGIVK